MKNKTAYLQKNKALWNKRTDYHLASQFYDVASFINGKSSLNEIELSLLGDISNKSILHLQCHFGIDTLSLARLGAKVTGIDLSNNSIKHAKLLADKINTKADFICCDLYSLPKFLDKKFDIVFTSYGTIGWLPDLDKWAKIVSLYLKPKAKFVFVDFHPLVWMYDNEFKKITYNYFNSGPIIETEIGTYADRSAPINQEYIGWNHSLSEVMTSLINAGLEIKNFTEIDYSPYNCFNNMVEFKSKKFRVKDLENKIPIVYSLVASKK